jgi:hypothetical protein
MKAFLILFVISIIGLSCLNQNSNRTKKNKDSEYSAEDEKDTNFSYDDKIDTNFNKIGLAWKVIDSVSQIVCDTTYKNKTEAPVKLQGPNCPFEPYMLVVNEGQLKLLNKNLKLIYNLKTNLIIHNAAWSPFNKSEIYLLAGKLFTIKRTEQTPFLPDTLFDLILYNYNAL